MFSKDDFDGPVNSRAKGARYERELARAFRAEGYHDARRGQQYSGANGDADVVGLPGIHVEAKRVERLNIHRAMDQAVRDAREGEIPVVFHRKNWRCRYTIWRRGMRGAFRVFCQRKRRHANPGIL